LCRWSLSKIVADFGQPTPGRSKCGDPQVIRRLLRLPFQYGDSIASGAKRQEGLLRKAAAARNDAATSIMSATTAEPVAFIAGTRAVVHCLAYGIAVTKWRSARSSTPRNQCPGHPTWGERRSSMPSSRRGNAQMLDAIPAVRLAMS